MRDRTPPASPKPWKTRQNLDQIRTWLEEGVDEDELLDLVDGAADLVVAGRKSIVWWTVGSLFGSRSLERWRAEVAAHRDEQRLLEEARTRRTELEQPEVAAQVVGLDAGDVSPDLRRHVERWRRVKRSPAAQLDLFGED